MLPPSKPTALMDLHDRALQKQAVALAGTVDFEQSLALIREGCRRLDEPTALAALLSPETAPWESLPALAWLALDESKSLVLRTAAVERLLHAGCSGAWPVARSILRTGNAHEARAPWDTWPRTGRYELPKRILALRLDAILPSPCGFEPNASWKNQADQLEALELTVPSALTERAKTFADLEESRQQEFQRGVARLMKAANTGDATALQAISLLLPHSRPTMKAALRHPGLSRTARVSFEQAPH